MFPFMCAVATHLFQCLDYLLLGHLQQSLVFIAAVPKGAHSVDVEAVLTLANGLPALLCPGHLDLLVRLATVLLKALLLLHCPLLPDGVRQGRKRLSCRKVCEGQNGSHVTS